MSFDLKAWRDVAAGHTTHDEIIHSSATEIPDADIVGHDEPVWYTYTVSNDGYVTLTNVEVRNAANQLGCEIPKLTSGVSAGCSELARSP
jgi:hypothetical protein